jgi:hypothetical protein
MSILRLVGVTQLAKVFKDVSDAARFPAEFWVGSAVPYGPFHEFGTTRITARPHWQPSIAATVIKFGLATRRQQNQFVNAMIEAPRGLVELVAFDLERAVKQSIASQGILDTGNYRGSIATGPTEEAAFGKSVGQTTK